jgi:hypothetical protein
MNARELECKSYTRSKFIESVKSSLVKMDDIYDKRRQIEEMTRRRTETQEKILKYFERKVTPKYAIGYDSTYSDTKQYQYHISFRLPVEEDIDHQIGFFFQVTHDYCNTYVKDYDGYYNKKEMGAGQIYMFIDYAEELLEKTTTRMKLTKYTDEYDLTLLIEGLKLLRKLRGDMYTIREGSPRPQYSADVRVDPLTGKPKKIRGTAEVNMPFRVIVVETK